MHSFFGCSLLTGLVCMADAANIVRGQYEVTKAPNPSPVATTTSSVTASYQTCPIDPIYLGLFSNTYIQYDVSTFCLSLLGSTTVTSCITTNTIRQTVAPTTIVTETRTGTTTVASSTSTITSTATVFDLGSPSLGSYAAGQTSSPAYPRVKRAFLNGTLEDAKMSLSSACACNPSLSAMTANVVCSATSTISQTTLLRTFTTVLVTSTFGVTTITETSSTTSRISPPVTKTSSATWTQPPATTCEEDTWEEWNPWQVTKTQPTTPSYPTPTTIPSGCPYNNGTLFKENADNCTYYQRLCGRTYAETDFFSFVAGYSTPEQCTGLCDALNVGLDRSCLGIVWTTANDTRANCRALQSLTTPLDSKDSIALLIMNLDNPTCKPKITSTTTTVASTSSLQSTSTLVTTTTSSSKSSGTMSSSSRNSSVSSSSTTSTIPSTSPPTSRPMSTTYSTSTPTIATSTYPSSSTTSPTTSPSTTSYVSTSSCAAITVTIIPDPVTITRPGQTITRTETVTQPITTSSTNYDEYGWH